MNEKRSHVLLCPNDGAVTNALHKITCPVTKLLDEKNTYPLLREAILDILTRWRRGTRIRPIDFDVSIRPACDWSPKRAPLEQFRPWPWVFSESRTPNKITFQLALI